MAANPTVDLAAIRTFLEPSLVQLEPDAAKMVVRAAAALTVNQAHTAVNEMRRWNPDIGKMLLMRAVGMLCEAQVKAGGDNRFQVFAAEALGDADGLSILLMWRKVDLERVKANRDNGYLEALPALVDHPNLLRILGGHVKSERTVDV